MLLLSGMIQSFTVQAFLPAAPLSASVRQQHWPPLVVPRRLLGVDSGRSKQRVNGCTATRMEVGVKDTDADEYGDSVRAFLKDYPTPTIVLAWVLRARASVLVAAVMLQVVVPISADAGPSAFLASAVDLVRSSSALLLSA